MIRSAGSANRRSSSGFSTRAPTTRSSTGSLIGSGRSAAAAGTSSRILIYHFETRDGLLREVLGQARQRQVEAFTDLIRLRPDEPYR